MGSFIHMSLSGDGCVGMIKLHMPSMDSWSYSFCINSTFHSFVFGLNRLSDIIGVSCTEWSLGLGLKSSNHGTQGSFHMLIVFPSPIAKQAPGFSQLLHFL